MRPFQNYSENLIKRINAFKIWAIKILIFDGELLNRLKNWLKGKHFLHHYLILTFRDLKFKIEQPLSFNISLSYFDHEPNFRKISRPFFKRTEFTEISLPIAWKLNITVLSFITSIVFQEKKRSKYCSYTPFCWKYSRKSCNSSIATH